MGIYYKKSGANPYHSQTEKLFLQFEKVQIIHVHRAAEALAWLGTFLTIPEEESQSILVTERRLLAPLSEELPKPEEVYNVEIATTFKDFGTTSKTPR